MSVQQIPVSKQGTSYYATLPTASVVYSGALVLEPGYYEVTTIGGEVRLYLTLNGVQQLDQSTSSNVLRFNLASGSDSALLSSASGTNVIVKFTPSGFSFGVTTAFNNALETYTTSGTYPNNGTAYVCAVGGGGGGAGSQRYYGGKGGGSGGLSVAGPIAVSDTDTITIGSGGTGGAAGGGTGNSGGATTFLNATANGGGSGGSGAAAGTPSGGAGGNATAFAGNTTAGAGTASGVPFPVRPTQTTGGGGGGPGLNDTGSYFAQGGAGAGSGIGTGGAGGTASNNSADNAGSPGTGYGAGGGGAGAKGNVTSGQAGGAGSAGVVYVQRV